MSDIHYPQSAAHHYKPFTRNKPNITTISFTHAHFPSGVLVAGRQAGSDTRSCDDSEQDWSHSHRRTLNSLKGRLALQ